MNIIDFMKSHKVASVVLALTLVAGAGVQVWIHYDKAEKAAAAETEKQAYMAELEAAEALRLEKEQAEREALIKSIEEDPIVLPQKRESKVQPKEETEPSEPADGTLREDGYVYIKGFGWIPPSAGVKGDIAHNAGTGEIIGQMG